jgi:hypothetical protein
MNDTSGPNGPTHHLSAALRALAESGNGSVILVGRGLALVAHDIGTEPWEQELAASSLAILTAIREAIHRDNAEGHGDDIEGQLRAAIAAELTEGSVLDEVIRLAAGGEP